MANYSSTSSGDFTTFLAGKLLDAAKMAKRAQERKNDENLESADPGNLFAQALNHERGAKLFDEKMEGIDSAKKTPPGGKPPSPQATSPLVSKTRSTVLKDATRELLSSQDGTQVNDSGLKVQVTRLFGAGILPKLIRAEGQISTVAANVQALNSNVIGVNNLLVDQNQLLLQKFDTIQEIFASQLAYQKTISDEGKVRRKENLLEQKQDLSKVRAFQGTQKGDATTDSLIGLGNIAQAAIKAFQGKNRQFVSNLFGLLASKNKKTLFGPVKKLGESVLGTKGRYLIPGLGKFDLDKIIKRSFVGVYDSIRTESLAEAIGLERPKGLKKPIRGSGAEKLADKLETVVDGLDLELGEAGLDALEDMYKGGEISASEYEQLKKTATRMKERGPGKPKKKKAISSSGARRIDRGVTKALSTSSGVQKALAPTGMAKLFGRGGKLVPGLGAAVALGEGLARLKDGDTAGFVMSLGSAIPLVGWGFLAADIARDMGFDPMGTLERYETGTNGLTKPGPAVLHGTEAIFGRADREQMLSSYKDSLRKVGSSLVSVSMALGDATGDGNEVSSLIKGSGLDYDVYNLPFSNSLGRISKTYRGELKTRGNMFTDFLESLLPGKNMTGIFKGRRRGKDGEDDGDIVTYTNKKLEDFPEYDIEYNEPNSVVRFGGKLYRTNELGGLGDEISLREANTVRTPRPRPSTTPLTPQGVNSKFDGSGPLSYPNLPGNAVTFFGGQGRDASGEAGVDFSFNDYKNNYAIFPGEVVAVGPVPGYPAYGNAVTIKSVNPNNPSEVFEGLYAHFPNGGIAVRKGQQIAAGEYLGKVGFAGKTGLFGGAVMQGNGAGRMSGWHTSLDFYSPDGGGWHPNANALVNAVIGMEGRAPTGSSLKVTPNEQEEQTERKMSTFRENNEENQRLQAGEGGIGKYGIGGPGISFRNKTEQRVYDALKSKGFTPPQISAIMANFDIETGGYRTMYQDDGGPGRGLAQWETPGRWDQALEWYASTGKNPKNLIHDIEGQIDWMMHEFGTIPTDSMGRPNLPYGFGYNLEDWKNSSNDVGQLTKNWMNWYEAPNPNYQHLGKRIQSSSSYLRKIRTYMDEIKKRNEAIRRQQEALKEQQMLEENLNPIDRILRMFGIGPKPQPAQPAPQQLPWNPNDPQIQKNDRLRQQYRNNPNEYFEGTISNMIRTKALELASADTEDFTSGEGTAVQIVFVDTSTTIDNRGDLPRLNRSGNDLSYSYRMAMLG